jgi:hypothetical protein
MSDLLDRQPPGTPRPRFAPEQGLASLFIGAVMFITAPMVGTIGMLILAMPARGKLLASATELLPLLGTTLPILLMLFGSFFGLVGVRRARREGGSVALPLAGLLLNLVAFVLWGVTAGLLFLVAYNK